jgi:hypothetical protein
VAIDPTQFSSPIDVFANGIGSISIGLTNAAIKDSNEAGVYPSSS